jgi:hypothetical protein
MPPLRFPLSPPYTLGSSKIPPPPVVANADQSLILRRSSLDTWNIPEHLIWSARRLSLKIPRAQQPSSSSAHPFRAPPLLTHTLSNPSWEDWEHKVLHLNTHHCSRLPAELGFHHLCLLYLPPTNTRNHLRFSTTSTIPRSFEARDLDNSAGDAVTTISAAAAIRDHSAVSCNEHLRYPHTPSLLHPR